jgi:putative PIN family toxin of toxin-antitoxin system
LDTNVLVAALRSKRGASFRLLSLVEAGKFEINVSVPLVLEYEDVLNRKRESLIVSEAEVSDLLDYLCQIANQHRVYYLWRPHLNDAKDDMLLELAVAANCDYIVTFNRRDFRDVEAWGIRVIEPIELLRLVGELP